MAYGRSRDGIDWLAIDERPVHHVIVIAGPPDRQHRYLQFLASVTLHLKRQDLREKLTAAEDENALFQILNND